MALLNEAIVPGVLTHIADHDLISRVVNERHGVATVNPVAGQHYAPDMALGETHVVTLPGAGVVTLDAPVSTDAERAWLPGAELVVVLVSPAGSTATVAWNAAYAAGGAPVPQAGTTVVGRWRNITTDASPAVWVPAAAPSGAFAGDVRAMALSATDVALVAKGFAGQSADIQQWQNSAGTALARVDNAGNVVSTQSLVAGAVQAPSFTGPQISMGSTGITMVNRTAVANVVAAFKGMAGQTGDLTQWQDSTGAVLAAFRSTGSLWVVPPTNPSVVVGNAPNLANGFAFLGHVTTAGTWFTDTAVNEGVFAANLATGKRLHVGKASTVAGLTPLSLSDEVAQVVAIFKGQASQSGDLTQWQNSAAATLAKVDSGGNFSGPSFQAGPVLGVGSRGSFTPYGPAEVVVGIQGFAAQTGDLQQWKDSTGAVLASVNAGGAFAAAYLAAGPGAAGMTAQIGSIPVNASTRGLVIQGAAAQAADNIVMQNSTGAVLAKFRNDGRLQLRPSADGVDLALDAGLTVSPRIAGGVGTVIAGLAAQSADLTQWRNSATTVVAKVDSGGNGVFGTTALIGNTVATGFFADGVNAAVRATGVTGTGGVYLQGPSGNPTYATFGMSNANLMIAPSTGYIPLVLRAAASQTADIQEWQNSASATLTRIDAAGVLWVGTTPAVGDVLLSPGTATTAGYIAWHGPNGNRLGYMGNNGNATTTDQGTISLNAGTFLSSGTAPGSVVRMVRCAASQTADLTQWQNSGGGVLAKVGPTGDTYAPSLHAGDLSIAPGAFLNAVSNNAGAVVAIMRGASSQTSDLEQWQNSAGTAIGRVNASGNVQGTGAYTTLSDAAVKTNVRELVHDPLDVIRRLKPRHFDYVAAGFGGDLRDQVGFVAQELQAVLPQAVVPFGDEHLGTRSEAVVAYLVAAVQELDRRVTAA